MTFEYDPIRFLIEDTQGFRLSNFCLQAHHRLDFRIKFCSIGFIFMSFPFLSSTRVPLLYIGETE